MPFWFHTRSRLCALHDNKYGTKNVELILGVGLVSVTTQTPRLSIDLGSDTNIHWIINYTILE